MNRKKRASEVEQAMCDHVGFWVSDNETGTNTCSICGKVDDGPGFVLRNVDFAAPALRLTSLLPWYKRLWNVLIMVPRYIITGEVEW